MQKFIPIKQKKLNVDKVVSFRIEKQIIDYLKEKGINPSASARAYLRNLAKEQGLTFSKDMFPEDWE